MEVHKVDLGGEGVASCIGTFDCFIHLFECPLGHHFLARSFQHLVFVARCMFFELWFASMPIVHHYSFHRLLVNGASFAPTSSSSPPSLPSLCTCGLVPTQKFSTTFGLVISELGRIIKKLALLTLHSYWGL